MVRTKDGGGAARTVASKAPRKALGGGGASAAASKAIAGAMGASSPGGKYSGGNSYCPQKTPGWQMPLTSFFSRDTNAPPPKAKEVEEDEDDEKPKEGNEEIKEESDTEEKGEKGD